jgi:enoyl-CoA hydratase
MELALWCDFRVMQEDAYFGLLPALGSALIDGGTVRLFASWAKAARSTLFRPAAKFRLRNAYESGSANISAQR